MKYINVLILFAVLLSACGQQSHQRLDENSVILAFGDSLTAGVGTAEETNYPSVLAELSGLKVINAGISGETTTEGLERYADVLDQYHPNLVILLEGGNDILRNQPADLTKKNLAAMIGLSQGRNIPVLLLAVPEKNVFSNGAKLYGELAEEFNTLFIKELVADLLRSPSLKSDPVHLNAQGYRALAQGVYDYLQDQSIL